jgi:hypothetical protein
MILKIRGYKKSEWWVYGEIMRIHYEEVDRESPVTEDCDLILFQEDGTGCTSDPTKCLKIILRFVNGDLFFILTDSIAYLCNDQGQTVEKIVV